MEVIYSVFSATGTVCAIVFSYLAFVRNKGKDSKADAEKDGMVLTEIGYIKSGVDDIKAEQREQRKTNTEMIARITAVESSAKQAHKRIDAIEDRRSRGEG